MKNVKIKQNKFRNSQTCMKFQIETVYQINNKLFVNIQLFRSMPKKIINNNYNNIFILKMKQISRYKLKIFVEKTIFENSAYFI